MTPQEVLPEACDYTTLHVCPIGRLHAGSPLMAALPPPRASAKRRSGSGRG